MTEQEIAELRGIGRVFLTDAHLRAMAVNCIPRLLEERRRLLEALREYHKRNRIHHDEEARLYDISESAIAFAEEDATTPPLAPPPPPESQE